MRFKVFLAASNCIYHGTRANYYAQRMNRARIVILNAILLPGLFIGGLSMCRTHFS